MPIPIKWNLLSPDRYTVSEISYELEIPIPAAAAYVNRGLDTPEKVQEFCDLGIHKFYDPYLLPDMELAVNRLVKAMKNNEKIHIHGDYDVDGITASAVIIHTLNKLGTHPTYHVPHRITDGYDVRPETIESAKIADIDLLISVDCGILAFKAAQRAKELGIDMIITDHHTPSDDGLVPDCVAVINAHRKGCEYPFKDLAGVGIAYKFMHALLKKVAPEREVSILTDLLEYVALGTVADVAPMVDENRTFVYLGCQQLTQSRKPGVAALLKVAGVKNVSTTSIGFFVAPRINAMGRLADPYTSLELLLETSPSRCIHLAGQLDAMNKKRQDKQDQIVEEARELLPEDMSDVSIIVLGARGWHPGLVGLVAGKLAEENARPALVCTINAEGIARGSCRSTRHFHILDALKSPECVKLLNKVGGHAFAAGFELPAENIPILREKINDYAKQITDGGIEPVRSIDIDYKITASDIDVSTFNALAKLAPFGNGNLEPIFIAKNLRIVKSSTVGSGKHLKLKIEAGKYANNWVQSMWWRHGDLLETFGEDVMVDVVFKLTMEEYLGRTNLSMIIEDMQVSKT